MKEEHFIERGFAIIGLSIVCSVSLYLTGGETGLGWFMFGLIIIF